MPPPSPCVFFLTSSSIFRAIWARCRLRRLSTQCVGRVAKAVSAACLPFWCIAYSESPLGQREETPNANNYSGPKGVDIHSSVAYRTGGGVKRGFSLRGAPSGTCVLATLLIA